MSDIYIAIIFKCVDPTMEERYPKSKLVICTAAEE